MAGGAGAAGVQNTLPMAAVGKVTDRLAPASSHTLSVGENSVFSTVLICSRTFSCR